MVHEVKAMRPLTKKMSKRESKALLTQLGGKTIRQVDVLKRAFIFRAYSLGISQADIGRLTGNSRQRIYQAVNRAAVKHPELVAIVGQADEAAIRQMITYLDRMDVSSLWENSEEFQFAMLRWVGVDA